MNNFARVIISACVLCVLGDTAVNAQLRGHGGPVRALAISLDGRTVLSGSFDNAAIRWSLVNDSAEQVLRFHEGAVNAVAILPDGGLVTAGEDGRLALWNPGDLQPARIFEGHRGPVVSLAVSPDGSLIASASWDRTVRLWDTKTGVSRVLEGHQQNVNAVAFQPDGKSLVSVSYDATLRIWPVADDAPPVIVTLPTPLNAVGITVSGEILTAGADGKVYFLSSHGEKQSELEIAPAPLIALAISKDGRLAGAASIRGAVGIIETGGRKLARMLVGPGLPVWSAVFAPDSRTLLTGGADRLIRRWDAETGEPIGSVSMNSPDDPLTAYADDPGAKVFRACVACHTLKPNEGVRAGPTLSGIFGRRIATLPGYNFTSALKKLDIVWTPETVARLFEIGPAAYTPGTKMPEQTIGSKEDRDALIAFLKKTTVQ